MKRVLLLVGAGVAALLLVVGVSVGTVYMAKEFLFTQPVAAQNGAAVDPAVKVTEETLVVLKPFVTNLADTDRARYISVTFELIVRDKKQFETNLPVVRDQIVTVLSTKKSQEVTGEAGANTLKNDIQKRLNDKVGGVQKVLITDLVIQ